MVDLKGDILRVQGPFGVQKLHCYDKGSCYSQCSWGGQQIACLRCRKGILQFCDSVVIFSMLVVHWHTLENEDFPSPCCPIWATLLWDLLQFLCSYKVGVRSLSRSSSKLQKPTSNQLKHKKACINSCNQETRLSQCWLGSVGSKCSNCHCGFTLRSLPSSYFFPFSTHSLYLALFTLFSIQPQNSHQKL